MAKEEAKEGVLICGSKGLGVTLETTRLHTIHTDSNHIRMAQPEPERNLVKICDNLWLQRFSC